MSRLLVIDGSKDKTILSKVIEEGKNNNITNIIDTATTYTQAVSLIKTKHYDCVVLGSAEKKARVSAMDVVNTLNRTHKNTKTPVVVIELKSSLRERLRGMLRGRELICISGDDIYIFEETIKKVVLL